MDTTIDSIIPERRPVARRVSAGGVLWWALVGAVSLVGVSLVGAGFLQLAGADLTVYTSRPMARVLAFVAGLLLAVALPLRMESRTFRAWRRMNPLTGRTRRGAGLLAMNLVVPFLWAFAAPDFVRASMLNHGAWMVQGLSPRIEAPVRSASAWLATRVPLGSPLAVTHGTSFERAAPTGCECR
jgi:hypothetical protein